MREYDYEQGKKIYHFINEYIFENGFPPTVREICKGVGMSSTSSVHYHLEKLEKEGHIKVKFGCPRAICILK